MVTIISDRLLLKTYSLDDVNPLYQAAIESSKDVYKWLPWCHPGYKMEEASAWITFQMEQVKLQKEYAFAIYLNSTKEFIGGVGINEIDYEKKSANLGYWIRTGYNSNGYATESAFLTLKFAFEYLNFHSIEIIMEIGNSISKKVAEKLNAKYLNIEKRKLHFFPEERLFHVFNIYPESIKKIKYNYRFELF